MDAVSIVEGVACSDLYELYGPDGYDIAQQALVASGWVYDILYDAWFWRGTNV